ncbi:MAG: anti-sigma factor family protein [Verrucomicrobiota bacterium]
MKLSRDLTCKEVVELVTEYLEGGLSAHERGRFEEHLGFCDWCVTYLEQMRQTVDSTGRLREEDLGPELQDALIEVFRGWRTE